MVVLKLFFYIISVWTILALFTDILVCFISHNPTDISWYVSNPLTIYKFPASNIGQHWGLLVWGLAFAITLFTAIFFL